MKMDEVRNSEEAKQWFLEHSEGQVNCVKPCKEGDTETTCVVGCFLDAQCFFNGINPNEEIKGNEFIPDSITLGTAAKGGVVKIYGNFADKVAFKAKIDAAKEVKAYAQANLMVNI